MNVLDLFCGAAGGWSLGLERAGMRTVAACEVDPWRRERFAANFPGVRMFADIRDVRGTDVGPVDVVAGSPPCQDASAANTKGRGVDGEQTGLFFEAIRLVEELRPAWAVFENSPRLRTRGVDRILARLEGAGYACWPLVVGADDCGAPHIRKRMWLVCADAQRAGVWEQSGRGGGQDGAGAAEPAHDPLAYRERQSEFAEHGEVGRALGVRADADGDGRSRGWCWGRAGLDVPVAQAACHPSGPGCDPLSEGRYGPQLAALERAVGPAGLEWNGGPGGSLRMVDGLPAGLARKHIAAYGDAVVPIIPEIIGRWIMKESRR